MSKQQYKINKNDGSATAGEPMPVRSLLTQLCWKKCF